MTYKMTKLKLAYRYRQRSGRYSDLFTYKNEIYIQINYDFQIFMSLSFENSWFKSLRSWEINRSSKDRFTKLVIIIYQHLGYRNMFYWREMLRITLKTRRTIKLIFRQLTLEKPIRIIIFERTRRYLGLGILPNLFVIRRDELVRNKDYQRHNWFKSETNELMERRRIE